MVLSNSDRASFIADKT